MSALALVRPAPSPAPGGAPVPADWALLEGRIRDTVAAIHAGRDPLTVELLVAAAASGALRDAMIDAAYPAGERSVSRAARAMRRAFEREADRLLAARGFALDVALAEVNATTHASAELTEHGTVLVHRIDPHGGEHVVAELDPDELGAEWLLDDLADIASGEPSPDALEEANGRGWECGGCDGAGS